MAVLGNQLQDVNGIGIDYSNGQFKSRDMLGPVRDPFTGEMVTQRTNTALEVSDGDAPAQKWLVDNRLPVAFKYGFAYGVNQITVPKGLIMAVDPIRYQKDFETGKMHSVLTIANGGVDVKYNGATKVWEALTAGAEQDGYTALTDDQKNADTTKRPANIPIGVNFANIMYKVDDAFNGMVPTVMTRKYIKLPLFADSAHALANPWGSAYGAIKPGDYVKSDLNGRFVKFNEKSITFSVDHIVTTGDDETQRMGQVLAIQKYLVPEGAAVWATWALEDRLQSDYFNPLYQPNANGEYPGYPYDKSYGYNDLTRMNPRIPVQWDIAKGIPGLTDGAHVVSETISDQVIDEIPAGTFDTMQNRYCRTLDLHSEDMAIKLRATYGATVVTSAAYTAVATLAAANSLKFRNEADGADINLGHVDFSDAANGLVVIAIDTPASLATANLDKVEVLVQYNKKGEAGVPTMLDWDGCMGEIRILLQK